MSEFKKTEAQQQAIKVLSGKAKHIALGGGSRSGKSFILMYAMIVRCCKIKSRHCIFRQSFNHVKRSIFLETFPKVMALCFPDLKYEVNKTDYIVTFINGSQIFFAGLDSGERVEKVLGSEFSGVWLNEISQIPYASLQIVLTRIAEKNDLAKKIYYDLNPGTKSSWPYYLFIKGLDPIENVPIRNPEEYAYFQMNPQSNLVNIDDDYLKILNAMPTLERNRFLLGEFNDTSDGQTYYEFKRELHVKSCERQPGTIFCAMDFNINPFCALLAQYINDSFRIFDEIYLENSDTYKMASELKKKGYTGALIIPDSTAKARKTSGMSDIQILNDSGFVVMDTLNPFVVDRVNNCNRLFAQNKIIIDPRCRKLINDFEKVSWKDNKLDQFGANKMLTHISDACGYLLWKLDPLIKIKEQRTIQL